MALWSDGYISKVGYTHGCYREMAPAHLRWALVCAGIRPTFDASAPTYCELGFGHGVSLLLNAASSPRGDFWGTDFSPSFTASAMELARAGGVSNARLFDDSFAEFLERPGLPRFDIIALHGVFSWISEANRGLVVEFIRRHLKIGGVVYISYNAMPGWAPLMPLRHLLAARLTGDGEPEARLKSALEIARTLGDHRAGYFLANPQAGPHLAQMPSLSMNYLVHEYLGENWSPQYHSQVAAELEAAKLQFVTSARAGEQMDGLTVPGEADGLMASAAGSRERETIRDFYTNTRFRRDVFVRGPNEMPWQERLQAAADTRFALVVPRDGAPTTAKLPLGEIEMQPELYGPLLDALAQGPKTFRELAQTRGLDHIPAPSLFQALAILTTVKQVDPCIAEDPAEGRESSRTMNAELVRRSEFVREIQHLASPVTGHGVEVNWLDQLVLLAEQRGHDPLEFVWKVFDGHGQRFIQEGEGVEDDGENRRLMVERIEMHVRDVKPMLQALGI